MIHEENIASYCIAWYELTLHGAVVEDCFIGGYDDLAPNSEHGGEA